MLVVRPIVLSTTDPVLPYHIYSYRLPYTAETESFRLTCKKETIRMYGLANLYLTIDTSGVRKAYKCVRHDMEHTYGPSYRVYREDIHPIEPEDFPMSTDVVSSTFDLYEEGEWRYEFYPSYYTVSWRGSSLPKRSPFA